MNIAKITFNRVNRFFPLLETTEGGYVYFEASEVIPAGVESLYFNVNNTIDTNVGCLFFAYHMYGVGMGSLAVKSEGNTFWTKSGNQGNRWFRTNATVKMNQTSSFVVSNIFSV